jgi:hypothetical protein
MSQIVGSNTLGRDWWIFRADRNLVVCLLGMMIFVVLVSIGLLIPGSIETLFGTSDPIETLFQGLVGAIITGVTLVLTINQLVLSQELGGLSDQSERMEGSMDFLREVEELLDEQVTPVEPSGFLRCLLNEINSRAKSLDEATVSFPDDRTDFPALIRTLRDEAEQSRKHLEDRRFGTFEVVSAALSFNYSRHLHRFRVIQAKMKERSENSPAELGELVELLKMFGPAREHIKTLYFQWDLIELSKAIIYTGLPALLVSIGTVLYLNNPGLIPGTTLGISNILLVVSLLTTISLTPFLVLVSYVVRVATVARRTLAMGPLVLND